MSMARCVIRAAMATGVLAAAGAAHGAGPYTFQKIIMFSDAVPGLPGESWNTGISSSIFSNPVVFDDGRVAFQGRMNNGTAGTPTTLESVGIWAGAPGALSLVARNGAGGPTLANPNNWVHANFLGAGNQTAGLGLGVTATQSGTIMLSSALGSTSNSGSAANNSNTAFWVGTPTTAGMTLVAQGGGVNPAAAPGTGNAIFSGTLALSQTLSKVNSAGQTYFTSTLVAGSGGEPTLSTSNDTGLWLASTSGVSLVAREGQATSLPQVSGVSPVLDSMSLGSQQLNSSGQMVFSQNLLVGTAGVSSTAGSANNGVLWSNPGGVLTPIARKNDPVPGIAGKTYNNTASLGFAASSQSFNNDGRLVFNAIFTGGGDALMTWKNGENGSVAHPVVKPGDAAPGITGNTFSSFNGTNPNMRLNNTNQFAFAATATDGSVTTTGIWSGALNASGEFGVAPALIVQQGQQAPGLDAGLTFASGFFGLAMNNLNQLVFQASLTGAGVTTSNDAVLCVYDPTLGLSVLMREGVDNGATLGIPGFATLGSFTMNASGTGDGGTAGFSDTGWLALSISEQGTTGRVAQIVTQIPAPGAMGLLGLGGLLAARRRRA